MDKYFDLDPTMGEVSSFSSVGYSERSQRVFISSTISVGGRPRIPMSQVCVTMLKQIEDWFPIDGADKSSLEQTWRINALGVLDRANHNDADYRNAIHELIDSAVVSGILVATYVPEGEKAPVHFWLGCQKQSPGGPIEFYKDAHRAGGRVDSFKSAPPIRGAPPVTLHEK